MKRPTPDPAGPGQESVWDYPRPAICAPFAGHLKIVFDGRTLAETRSGARVLETSHPPSYYIPLADVKAAMLAPGRARSVCEWKGAARYFDVAGPTRAARDAAWTYPSPVASFALIKDMLAVYPGRMDACFVDGEQVEPQPGGFYGGWITSKIAGPFKGGPGTMGW